MPRVAGGYERRAYSMNKHNQVDQNTAEKHMANETVTGTRIEDIIAMVSDLESDKLARA